MSTGASIRMSPIGNPFQASADHQSYLTYVTSLRCGGEGLVDQYSILTDGDVGAVELGFVSYQLAKARLTRLLQYHEAGDASIAEYLRCRLSALDKHYETRLTLVQMAVRHAQVFEDTVQDLLAHHLPRPLRIYGTSAVPLTPPMPPSPQHASIPTVSHMPTLQPELGRHQPVSFRPQPPKPHGPTDLSGDSPGPEVLWPALL